MPCSYLNRKLNQPELKLKRCLIVLLTEINLRLAMVKYVGLFASKNLVRKLNVEDIEQLEQLRISGKRGHPKSGLFQC